MIGAEGGAPRRITTHPGFDAKGNWSPGGQWIYFASNRTGTYQVWKVPLEGGDPVQVTKEGGWSPQVSPDGESVYYCKRPGLPRDLGFGNPASHSSRIHDSNRPLLVIPPVEQQGAWMYNRGEPGDQHAELPI